MEIQSNGAIWLTAPWYQTKHLLEADRMSSDEARGRWSRREWRSRRVQRGLTWPPRIYIYIYKEISCTLRLTLIKGTLIRKRSSPPRHEGHLYFTIKTPKPSQIKVCIIYPSSGTLELWKFSNLAFEGYLAGTTLVLSVRSSSSFLHKSCLDYMRTAWLTDDF